MNDPQPSELTSVGGSLREKPWPHFIIDEFLGDAEFARLVAAAKRPSREFEIEPGDEHQVEFSLLEDIELAKNFISIEFVKLLRRLTGVWCYLGEGYVQVRRATPETPEFPVHVDSGGPRSFVAIHYVSPDWSPTHGGGLRMHAAKTGLAASTVDPIPNRLVVFEAAPDHWHSVEKTLGGARYSILSKWIAST
jgi:hypothetical protein